MYTSVAYDININKNSSFQFNCVAGYVSPHNSGICDPIIYYIILYCMIFIQSMGLLSSNLCFLIYLRLWKNSAHFWSNLRHCKKSAEKMCRQRKHPSWWVHGYQILLHKTESLHLCVGFSRFLRILLWWVFS